MDSRQTLFLLRHRRQRHAAAGADPARRRAARSRAPTARSTRAARADKFDFLRAQRHRAVPAGRQRRHASRTRSSSPRPPSRTRCPTSQAARRVGAALMTARRAAGRAVQRGADCSIGVAGTSGKSTTTGMIGWILHDAGRDPTVMNGAVMKNFVTPDAPFASALVGSERHLRQRGRRERRLDRALHARASRW